MDRRRFMKNVGLAVVGLGLVGSAQAKAALKTPSIDDLIEAGIAERCEGSFIPEWQEKPKGVSYFVRFKCNMKRYFDLLACVGTINADMVAFKEDGKSTHYHPAGGVIFLSLHGEGPANAISAVAEFKNRYLQPNPEIYDLYRSSDFDGLLKSDLFTEIKE